MILVPAHVTPVNMIHEVEAPEMLLTVQNARMPDYSVLDPTTIMRNWINEGPTAKSRIGDFGRSITNLEKTTTLMCCAVGKPRLGKYMMRVKFTGSGTYYCAVVALSSYSLAGRIAYTDYLALNTWHTVKVEMGADGLCKVYVNSTLTCSSKLVKDVGLYVFNNIDKVEIDAGQLGSPLLDGYEWL